MGAERPPVLGVLIVPDIPVDAVVARACHAESAGMDAVWVADEKFYRDPFITLTAIAARTTRVRLGTCVTEPYSRHPALIAMAMGTLAEQAPGRVVIGMGAGGSGFPPMHVERRSPGSALREAAEIIRGLLAGEEVTVEGKAISFTAGQLNFSTSPLPIYLAGRGPRVLSTAGEVGDGVIAAPFASKITLNGAAQHVANGVERRSDGLRPPLVARVDVAISSNHTEAYDAVRYQVALPIWSSYPNLDYLAPTGVELPLEACELMATKRYDAIARVAPLLPTEIIDHFAVAGSYDDVERRLRELAAIADEILINPVPTTDVNVETVISNVARMFDR